VDHPRAGDWCAGVGCGNLVLLLKEIDMKEYFRISEVETGYFNNRPIKLFKAHILEPDGNYYFEGEFTAPAGTPDENLPEYIIDEE
jgi:hypothetical protein